MIHLGFRHQNATVCTTATETADKPQPVPCGHTHGTRVPKQSRSAIHTARNVRARVASLPSFISSSVFLSVFQIRSTASSSRFFFIVLVPNLTILWISGISSGSSLASDFAISP
jgi:hypothetical protein